MKQNVNPLTGEVIPRYRNQANAHEYTHDAFEEKNLEPSKTIPGQSMTVQEMVARHKKGLPIDSTKGALYAGEEFLPDLSSMDEIDKAAYMDSVADALVEARARVEAAAKTQKQKDWLKAVDEEVRKQLAKIKPIDPDDTGKAE